MSREWGLCLPVLSQGRGFVHNDRPRGKAFALFRVISQGFMVLDEIHSCIIRRTTLIYTESLKLLEIFVALRELKEMNFSPKRLTTFKITDMRP